VNENNNGNKMAKAKMEYLEYNEGSIINKKKA